MGKVKIIIVLWLLTIFIGLAFYQPAQKLWTSKSTTQSENKITQIVYLPNRTKKLTISYEVETALALLQRTAAAKTDGQGENTFVKEIDGIEAKSIKHQYWAFYINKKLSPVGAGGYKLKPNDFIEWKLESY